MEATPRKNISTTKQQQKRILTPAKKLRASLDNSSVQELRSKYDALKADIAALNIEIETLTATGVDANLTNEMRALHDYNEIKDLTQSVLGQLANIEQTTAAALHAKYNLPLA